MFQWLCISSISISPNLRSSYHHDRNFIYPPPNQSMPSASASSAEPDCSSYYSRWQLEEVPGADWSGIKDGWIRKVVYHTKAWGPKPAWLKIDQMDVNTASVAAAKLWYAHSVHQRDPKSLALVPDFYGHYHLGDNHWAFVFERMESVQVWL